MSAVSKRVMPASSAASRTAAVPSRSSRLPKLLQPRPTTETSSSESPRRRLGSSAISVRPAIRHQLAIAALGLGAADGDDLEPIGTSLESAHDVRSDAHDVPLAQLDRLIVELDPPRAADHDVGLLLHLVAVPTGDATFRRVAEVADSQLLGIEELAREAPFDSLDAGRVLDLHQVLDRIVADEHQPRDWRCPARRLRRSRSPMPARSPRHRHRASWPAAPRQQRRSPRPSPAPALS